MMMIMIDHYYQALFSNTNWTHCTVQNNMTRNTFFFFFYIHFNKRYHSRHIYTPTYTQSIATGMHDLPRPVKSAVQKGKS